MRVDFALLSACLEYVWPESCALVLLLLLLFLLYPRYREVVETVMRFKDSKEKQIRRAVINLLPRLASFAPERFAQVR